ncbi:hypothetical protein HK101_007267 [Irineochytrium annulatum]|nr:hypothetical protein HK101_007267 [Irineochytrium annulatum]
MTEESQTLKRAREAEDDGEIVQVASTIEDVAAPVPQRPRLDDTQSKKRGQRMFGVLLGTLSKFKETSTKKSEADLRREELEQRLQAKIQKQKEELSEKLRLEGEQRRARVQAFKEEEERKRLLYTTEIKKAQALNLSRYLKTKTEPVMFFMPAKHTEATQKILEESKAAHEASVAESEAAMKDDAEPGDKQGATSGLDGGGGAAGEGTSGKGEESEEIREGLNIVDDEAEEPVVGEVF